MNVSIRCANAIRNILDKKEEELEAYRSMYDSEGRKESRHVGIQCKCRRKLPPVPKKWDAWTQIRMDTRTKETQEEGSQEHKKDEGSTESLEKKLEEVTRRMKYLEDREKKNEERDREVSWTKVLERRSTRRILDQGERGRTAPEVREETTVEREDREGVPIRKDEEGDRRRRKPRPLRALEKRLPKGAGIILESSWKYKEETPRIMKMSLGNATKLFRWKKSEFSPSALGKQEKEILIEILIEVRCEDEEEKAEHLTGLMKEVVKAKEGARVWCPLRRLKLRVSGLPLGVETKIAAAVARQGEGKADRVRVGPLRTSASGASVAWVNCTTRMAMRLLAASEHELGTIGGL